MRICVMGGAGYVGLITGIGLAEAGNHVTNVDVDLSRILQLQSGELPIHEPGLDQALRNCHEITCSLLHAQLYLMGDS